RRSNASSPVLATMTEHFGVSRSTRTFKLIVSSSTTSTRGGMSIDHISDLDHELGPQLVERANRIGEIKAPRQARHFLGDGAEVGAGQQLGKSRRLGLGCGVAAGQLGR